MCIYICNLSLSLSLSLALALALSLSLSLTLSVVKCSGLGQLCACTSVTKYRPRHMWRVEGGPDVGNITLPVSVVCNILLARDSASPLQKLGHGHRLKGQRQPEDKRMTGKAKGGGR